MSSSSSYDYESYYSGSDSGSSEGRKTRRTQKHVDRHLRAKYGSTKSVTPEEMEREILELKAMLARAEMVGENAKKREHRRKLSRRSTTLRYTPSGECERTAELPANWSVGAAKRFYSINEGAPTSYVATLHNHARGDWFEAIADERPTERFTFRGKHVDASVDAEVGEGLHEIRKTMQSTGCSAAECVAKGVSGVSVLRMGSASSITVTRTSRKMRKATSVAPDYFSDSGSCSWSSTSDSCDGGRVKIERSTVRRRAYYWIDVTFVADSTWREIARCDSPSVEQMVSAQATLKRSMAYTAGLVARNISASGVGGFDCGRAYPRVHKLHDDAENWTMPHLYQDTLKGFVSKNSHMHAYVHNAVRLTDEESGAPRPFLVHHGDYARREFLDGNENLIGHYSPDDVRHASALRAETFAKSIHKHGHALRKSAVAAQYADESAGKSVRYAANMKGMYSRVIASETF